MPERTTRRSGLHRSPRGRARLRALTLALLCGATSCAALAGPRADRRGRDTLDVAYGEAIAAATTEPRYLTAWVDHLPTSRAVPSPLQFLGYPIGAPDHLTAPETINEYFRELARRSPRVEVFSMGRSHGGREMLVAVIGSKRHLRALASIKARNHELADPRATDEARAAAIAQGTPPMFWMTAGLHSPETGPPEMVMELAYRLAVSEQDHIREIRDNVVVMITPVLEMDGRARMVDWWKRHLQGVTELEDAPPRMAPYWGDYTAHDNNRDGLQATQPLTRNYIETFHEYLPVVTLDLHESVPLLYVSTGTGPYNSAIDPITVAQWQLFASHDLAQASALGLQGVWTWGFYTGWYPGYLLWVSTNHHGVGRFYETFGNSHPGTFERDLSRAEFADQRLNSRQWYRPWPPDKKVTWSLRNNTNYMQTAVLASLQLTARHGDQLLLDFWRKHRNAVARGREGTPRAFWIPAAQRDRGALHELLALLSRHRVEVHELTEARALEEPGGAAIEVAAGDLLVRMDQPYSNLARTLLLAQAFPKSAQHTPYDDVAWSLDYMLGVELRALASPAALELPVRPLPGVPALPGEVAQGSSWVIDHRGQAALASLVWGLPAGARVQALRERWEQHPPGSLVISGIDRDALADVAGPLHLDAAALSGRPPARALLEVNRPRVALFHTWRYTQDSGWARYTLERLGVPYTLIDKDDLRAGGLGERFDVILVPSQGGMSLRDIVHGIDTRWGPLEYTKTDAYPSHGVIDSSPDITGGMGYEGLGALERFVTGGGVLLGLGSGGALASEGGLARPVSTSRPGGSPGSHVTTKVLRPEHPLAWGYPELDWVFRGNLPVYDLREYDRGHVIAQFGDKTFDELERERDREGDVALAGPDAGDVAPAKQDVAPAEQDAAPAEQGGSAPAGERPPFVRSGHVEKPKALQRKPAAIDVPVGRGRVILYSWNPLHRHQNQHDFAWVTNALLFFDDMPCTPTREAMRARERPDGAPAERAACRR